MGSLRWVLRWSMSRMTVRSVTPSLRAMERQLGKVPEAIQSSIWARRSQVVRRSKTGPRLRWIGGLVDEWIDGGTETGWIDGSVDEWIDEGTETGWIGGLVDEWIDEPG